MTILVSKQFRRWFAQIGVLLISYCSRAQSATYGLINLHTCPVCEVQYSYDFTIAVRLAMDNLEIIDNGTASSNNNEILPAILGRDPDPAGQIIFQDIPLQCDKNNADLLVDNSTTVAAVLSGECPLTSFGKPDEYQVKTAQLDNFLKMSYSPNIGELSTRPLSDFSHDNTIHMFPLQMTPATVLTLLEFYGWKKAIVLTEQDTQLETLGSVTEALGNHHVVTVNIDSSSSLQEPKQLLEQILERDYRVIVLNTYPPAARQFLCQAYRLNKMHYPQYVWLLPGWYEENWWRTEDGDGTNSTGQGTDCTLEEMKKMLINSFGIMEAPSDYLGQHKPSYSAFYSLYSSMVAFKNEENNITRHFASAELAAFAYDSVWLLAAALGEHNASNDYILTADDVLSVLKMEDYFGTSGRLSFDEAGWRIATQAYVTLYREDPDQLLKKIVVGIVQNTSGNQPQFVYTNNESASTVWSGDENPPIRFKINGIVLPLTIVYYTLATLGILFAAFCIGFNLKYRKYKVIRLSSPNLNYITCAGAIILLLSTFFIGSPSKMTSLFPFLCMGNVWAGAIGASLQYGTIQAKMFRVYVIFRRPGQKNIILKDWHLAMYVAVLVAIDVIMLSVVTAIPEARSVGKLVVDHEHPPFRDSTGVTVMSTIHDCESQEKGVDTYWFVLLFGYKLVLQIVVTVLAFLICSTKVEIEALNDHRAVQAITYVNMVILIISVALAFAVSNFANAKAAVNGLSVLVGAYFNLSLVFLPKMYALYKDPEGRQIFKSAGNSTSIVGGTPEQSTTSSVASRRVFAKEDNSDASNSGCIQLITAAQHLVAGSSDTNVVMAMDNGMYPQSHMTTTMPSTQPHPLSFTIANDSVSGSTVPTPESQSDETYLETTMDTETKNEPMVLLPEERAV